MRAAPRVITDDDLHATLARVSSIGSPHPQSVSRRSDSDDSSSFGCSSPAGAAAAPYNLDACFTMVEPVKLGEGT